MSGTSRVFVCRFSWALSVHFRYINCGIVANNVRYNFGVWLIACSLKRCTLQCCCCWFSFWFFWFVIFLFLGFIFVIKNRLPGSEHIFVTSTIDSEIYPTYDDVRSYPMPMWAHTRRRYTRPKSIYLVVSVFGYNNVKIIYFGQNVEHFLVHSWPILVSWIPLKIGAHETRVGYVKILFFFSSKFQLPARQWMNGMSFICSLQVH